MDKRTRDRLATLQAEQDRYRCLLRGAREKSPARREPRDWLVALHVAEQGAYRLMEEERSREQEERREKIEQRAQRRFRKTLAKRRAAGLKGNGKDDPTGELGLKRCRARDADLPGSDAFMLLQPAPGLGGSTLDECCPRSIVDEAFARAACILDLDELDDRALNVLQRAKNPDLSSARAWEYEHGWRD